MLKDKVDIIKKNIHNFMRSPALKHIGVLENEECTDSSLKDIKNKLIGGFRDTKNVNTSFE
jgi:hypothetical protein